MRPQSNLIDDNLAGRIRRGADPETTGQWPSERLQSLRDCGVFRWGLPVEFGGIEVSRSQMLSGYLELSRICLTTTFILTQRDAACHRIAASSNRGLQQRLLPEHCAGSALATVGVSHLSTSRQHWSRPSVVASESAGGFELAGEIPWVTGARFADLLVTGAALPSREQILVAIPTRRQGVHVSEPLKLAALTASWTGSVVLDHVAVGADEVVAGPSPHVMLVGTTGGPGSLTTTAVAIGAAASTVDGLRTEAAARPELSGVVDRLAGELARLRDDLERAAGGETHSGTAETLRHRANTLAMRSAQAYVCAAKGAGFVAGHPAERSLREAIFFQVWSCPAAVTRRTLDDLAPAASKPSP